MPPAANPPPYMTERRWTDDRVDDLARELRADNAELKALVRELRDEWRADCARNVERLEAQDAAIQKRLDTMDANRTATRSSFRNQLLVFCGVVVTSAGGVIAAVLAKAAG